MARRGAAFVALAVFLLIEPARVVHLARITRYQNAEQSHLVGDFEKQAQGRNP